MAEIIPRWEWRSFGKTFGVAEERLAQLTPGGIQDSDEIYLLSPTGENVKIRDGLMDVKILKEINADALQQWTPVMKAGFPLDAAAATTVFESLRVPAPAPLAESYTFESLLTELAKSGTVRIVQVHKRRVRYKVNGCMSELDDLVINGRLTRSIAIESEDAAAVVEAVHQLGLDNYVNTSYLRGMLSLLDDELERYAVIDIGTNSVKFNISERTVAGDWRTLVDRAEITRIGEGLVPGGPLQPAALQRTREAVIGMFEEAKLHHAREIVTIATAALRIASNSDDAIGALRRRTGLQVEVLSGDEEARLAFLAAKSGLGLGAGSMVVFDSGGGSSQFTFGHDDVVDERFSVNVGSVGYTERFGLDKAVSSEVLQQARAAIAADLSRLDHHLVADALVGMGGTVTNLTAIMHRLAPYNPDVVQGSVLTAAEIDRQIDLFSSRDADGRREIIGLQPRRAEVILAGACIVRTIMEKLGQDHFTVSDRGLRHGALAERFGE